MFRWNDQDKLQGQESIGRAMTQVTTDTILKTLLTVRDPQRADSVIAEQMIQGLSLKDGHVTFAVEVDPSQAKLKEPLRQACERAVLAIPGVRSVTAVLTAHNPKPNTPEITTREGARNPKGVEAIVAVASGKGGVGKSTVTVNLAIALSRLGLRTGILDADIYGPSIPKMLGLTGKPTSKDGKILEPMKAWDLKTMSIGSLVREDNAMIWRGPMVMSAITQLLFEVNWGPLDVLLVDMPPGTGDAQLTLSQRVPMRGAVIVSTPQDIALLDARRGIAMFQQTQVPVLGIIENMSTFICPQCGGETQIFGHGGARETAARLGCDFLGEVPLHIAIRQTSDAGTPIMAAEPASAHAQAFLAIAARVAEKLQSGTTRPAPTITFDG
jgi:ATP-binding protein involved in chromosome partitioning